MPGLPLPWTATSMRKTPSYLKGLAEDRARADGEVRRLQGLLDELAPKLAEAQRLQTLERDISARQAEAQTKRDACDTLIRSFDTRLDPEDIEPIRAWKGRYGKRGMLRTTIMQILERVAPAEITTTELRMTLELELQLCFSSQAERNTWSDNSLLSALRNLAKEGLVDRLHDPMDHGSGVGRWRWKGGANCGLRVEHHCRDFRRGRQPGQAARSASKGRSAGHVRSGLKATWAGARSSPGWGVDLSRGRLAWRATEDSPASTEELSFNLKLSIKGYLYKL